MAEIVITKFIVKSYKRRLQNIKELISIAKKVNKLSIVAVGRKSYTSFFSVFQETEKILLI